MFLCIGLSLFAQTKVTLKSPDGTLVYELRFVAQKPLYRVIYKGKVLVDDSGLSLDFKDGDRFGAGLKILRPVFSTVDDTYELPVGKAKTVRDVHRQALIPLVESGEKARRVNLIVRAFDDGLAMRYEFPTQENWKEYSLIDENTWFNVAGNPRIISLHFDNYVSSHEGLYQKFLLSELPEKKLMDMPALIEFPGKIYMAITEASLRDYAGMYLTKVNGRLKSQLSPLPGQQDVKVKAVLPHRTPWRVMLVSDRIGALIESNMLTSLNEPTEIKDLSWLKPGKTSFHWWNGDVVPDTTFSPGVNFETNKYYIDFCARNNIEYHSVIGYGGVPWYPTNGPGFGDPGTYSDVTKTIPSLDMQQICDYAKQKGVGIHVWVHWRALYPQLEAAFSQFEKWGIKGMMVDFMDRDDQEMVKIQEEILSRAAAHKLFIQFHGSFKPTGLSRTYPNEFTREGTLNYENNKWLEAGISPEHDLDIAFTRLLAGASDYHLGGFRAVKPEQFKTHYVRPFMIGTRCHMLAMYVVLESYLQMLADFPAAYEGQPGFDFLRKIPTTWDETRVLNAELGETITIARRRGKEWYVGTLNNSKARSLKIKLDFLSEGNHMAEVYSDAADAVENPNNLTRKTQQVKNGETLEVHLASGGGQVLRIVGM
ncbi:glycoside hydrolase family 97 protein [Dyadobacter pollutisoli]|uniref:Glycoside hydrolase family 97 protein n=1 Tax=Dyadobacter pollutisoli TaxID=2910158 RepID=A0A9E8SS77_9BACT|nr:glycoside hydrolase family 97 protein [Dyadobacter pollutisoli]WAC15032.1 glycoside hydrolase family 97 protein [Dyadobacter pollutisoli]